MKNHCLILAFLATIAFTGCDEAQVAESPTQKTLIGLLNPAQGVLYHDGQDLETVLAALDVEAVGDSAYMTFYDAGESDSATTFKLQKVDDLPVWAELLIDEALAEDGLLAVHKDARCGKQHPGFVSPCMGTFGKHLPFGQSMIWTINPWKSCQDGDTICVDKWKQVGFIDYFALPNCIGVDTVRLPVPIRKWRCD